MSKRTIVVNHTLGKEEALERIKRAAPEALKKYAQKIKEYKVKIEEGLIWDGYVGMFKLSVMGFRASSTVTITDSQVTVDTNLPPIPFFLKNKVKQGETDFRKELETILSQP